MQDLHALAADRFSQQRNRGFRRLAFTPELEEEFETAMLEQQRGSAILCASVGLVIWFLFALFDLYRLYTIGLSFPFEPVAWLWLSVRWAVLVAFVAFLVVARNSKRSYQHYAFLLYLALGAATAITSMIAHSYGVFAAEVAQIIIVMAAFLPIGLSFYQALSVSITIAIIGIACLWIGPPREHFEMLQVLLVLLLAVPLAALGGYLREYATREQFLLRGMLNKQAMVDGLTGLSNRRYFDDHAQTAIGEARRMGSDLSLAIFDIDHFKLFNDRYGHARGDEALKAVALCLANCVRRPLDIAARLGGEEFCLVLYGANEGGARDLIRIIMDDIAELGIIHSASTHGVVTVSAGLAILQPDDDLPALLDRADKALYAAKAGGRAALCILEAEPEEDVEPRLLFGKTG